MKKYLFYICLTLTFVGMGTASAGLFDNYPRGKKGDVVAEMRSTDSSKWKPDVLFFGGADEDFNFRSCEEYRDIMNSRLKYFEYRCVPNR